MGEEARRPRALASSARTVEGLQSISGAVGDRARADGPPVLDVALDDGAEDRLLSLGQHDADSRSARGGGSPEHASRPQRRSSASALRMIWLPPCSATVSTTTRAVVGLLDGAGDRHLLLGEAHAAELDREALQRARVAAGDRGVGARDLGHRPEAVQDAAGQADRLGELGVDVDRVEVAGGARRSGAVRHLSGVTFSSGIESPCFSSAICQTPLTMLVQVPCTTWSPSWLVETVSKT